jgi:hypothetical protein
MTHGQTGELSVMQEISVIVDFNGIVIFDPVLLGCIRPEIGCGENLYQRFTQTNEGDEVVKQGIVVPIIGINDSIYRVLIRDEAERSQVDPELIVVSNHGFPLKIVSQAVITDLASFLEWNPEEDWQKINVSPGDYSVRINGFRKIKNKEVVDFGFEVVLGGRECLPEFSASLAMNMQVLELPDKWF